MVATDFGAFFVYVKQAKDFPRMNQKVENSCNPYFTAKVGNEKKQSIKRVNTTVRDDPVQDLRDSPLALNLVRSRRLCTALASAVLLPSP